jgi:hypothetical protein
MFQRFPSKHMAIAFASNTHDVYPPLVQRLYELLTDEPWEIPVYAKDPASQAFCNGLNEAFDYGGAWFDRCRRPFTDNPQEMAKAFDSFNRAVNLGSLQSDYRAGLKAIVDGLHPVAGAPFIKVGSFMAAKLREKYGAEHDKIYHTMGAISFFADYIKLYQSQPNFSKELRFNEDFEKLITKWNEDWTRTWNDQTRHIEFTDQSDFDAIGRKLKLLFANAEVYPDLINSLLAIQRDIPAAKATKLTVELYPQSARANGKWGLLLLLINQYGEEGREYLRKNIGEPKSRWSFNRMALPVLGTFGMRWGANGWMPERSTTL